MTVFGMHEIQIFLPVVLEKLFLRNSKQRSQSLVDKGQFEFLIAQPNPDGQGTQRRPETFRIAPSAVY